jgi:hypothetical protein
METRKDAGLGRFLGLAISPASFFPTRFLRPQTLPEILITENMASTAFA